MANYLIIGSDGKEYGPVTDTEVRQWIAEGRLNGQSMAKAESDSEFRPLSAFPEFAGALHSAPPTLPAINPDAERLAAMSEVRAPAISLMVVSVLGFLLSLWGLIRLVFFPQSVQQEIEKAIAQYPQLKDAHIQEMLTSIYGPIGIASNLFAMVISALIFVAALKLQKLKLYPFAIVAAILVMLPCATNCCVWVFGLPIGIWTLIVLNKKSVKTQFK